MGRYLQGEFKPTNPDKYIGTYPIYMRSSWEFALARMLDSHPSVINWASESIKIPYINPFTNKHSIYIPDFLIIYDDANGKRHAEIIEVKPLRESSLSEAKSIKDKAAVALNAYKWQAAHEWAHNHNMSFRVISENSLFNNSGRK